MIFYNGRRFVVKHDGQEKLVWRNNYIIKRLGARFFIQSARSNFAQIMMIMIMPFFPFIIAPALVLFNSKRVPFCPLTSSLSSEWLTSSKRFPFSSNVLALLNRPVFRKQPNVNCKQTPRKISLIKKPLIFSSETRASLKSDRTSICQQNQRHF